MNQYTPPEPESTDLFEGFQRRFFRELPFAALAGYEVIGVSHGYRGSEVEVHPLVVALRTGDFF